MTPDELVIQLLTPQGDFAAAYDALVVLGASAIPALVAAIARGRGVPMLGEVLSALHVDDPVAAFAPLLEEFDEVHDAAVRALGASGRAEALPLLLDALPIDQFVAPDALANLGLSSAADPLFDSVQRLLGSAVPSSKSLQSSARCLDLRIAMAVAGALARLGDQRLAGLAIHLATLRDAGEHSDAALVRTAAARALYFVTAPGVAVALRSAAVDRDVDTAKAALLGTLYLGRLEDARTWIDIAMGNGPTASNAAWCLSCWAGETIAANDARRWWVATASQFSEGVCYRFGEPIDIGRLVAELPQDPRTLRAEVRVRTGARVVREQLTGYPVPPQELAEIQAWWTAHASQFPPGKLHRWGRTFEPGAVD